MYRAMKTLFWREGGRAGIHAASAASVNLVYKLVIPKCPLTVENGCCGEKGKVATISKATSVFLKKGGFSVSKKPIHQSIRSTIFPFALFSSMHVCAATTSSRPNVLPIWTFKDPSSICLISSCRGVFMKSSFPPE